jgi:hypothetical protein
MVLHSMLALFFPWAILLILHRPLQALMCLALQISLVGWPFATFWAIYQLISHHPYYVGWRGHKKK